MTTTSATVPSPQLDEAPWSLVMRTKLADIEAGEDWRVLAMIALSLGTVLVWSHFVPVTARLSVERGHLALDYSWPMAASSRAWPLDDIAGFTVKLAVTVTGVRHQVLLHAVGKKGFIVAGSMRERAEAEALCATLRRVTGVGS